MKPQKTFEDLEKEIQEDTVRKESFFKTPSTGSLKIMERAIRVSENGTERSGRPDSSRSAFSEEKHINPGMASLSFVNNYDNRFSKELSQDGASQRRTQEVKAPGNANPETRVCFEFMRGRCQLGKGCLYSHEPADCLRKVEQDYYKLVTGTWLPESVKKTWNMKAVDDWKQEFQKRTGNVKVLSSEDGELIESKHTEVYTTPGQAVSNPSTPGSSVSKLSRLQQATFRELAEESEETGEY